MNLESFTAVVYLDKHGRYAKQTEEVATVVLFRGDGCDDSVELTSDEYDSLSEDDRTTLGALPGRPECIDTTHKSNA